MDVLKFYALFSPTQLPQLFRPSVCWQGPWRDDLYIKSVLMADDELHGQLELSLVQPEDLSTTPQQPQETPRQLSPPPPTSNVNEMTPMECIDLIESTESESQTAEQSSECPSLVETYKKMINTEVTPTISTPRNAASLKRSRRKKMNSKEDDTYVTTAPASQKRRAMASTKLFIKDEIQENANNQICNVSNTVVSPGNVSDRPAPSSRWGHTFCWINYDKILLVGGQGQKHTLSRDSVWVLDYECKNWTVAPVKVDSHKPQYRMGHTVTFDPAINCAYVFGGSKNLRWYNDVHILDVRTWTFSLVKTVGKAPTRAYHSSCLYRNELFVFGGVYPNPDPQPDGCSNDIFIYRPETHSWYEPIVTGDKPTARSGHSATVIGDRMVVFGGWDAPVCYNDLIILDLCLMDFTKPITHGTPPSPRSWHASCRLPGNQILIHGGFNGNNALHDAFIFSLDDLTWSTVDLPIMSTPKAGHTIVWCYPSSSPTSNTNESDLGKTEIIMFGGGDNEYNFSNDLFAFKIEKQIAVEDEVTRDA